MQSTSPTGFFVNIQGTHEPHAVYSGAPYYAGSNESEQEETCSPSARNRPKGREDVKVDVTIWKFLHAISVLQ